MDLCVGIHFNKVSTPDVQFMLTKTLRAYIYALKALETFNYGTSIPSAIANLRFEIRMLMAKLTCERRFWWYQGVPRNIAVSWLGYRRTCHTRKYEMTDL